MYRVHHQVISKVLLTVFMEVLQAFGLIGKKRKNVQQELLRKHQLNLAK